MFRTYKVYQLTNTINNKIYIGVHGCSKNCLRYAECPYYGSGWIIKRAIKKHGKDNFNRIILATYFDRNLAYQHEAKLVDIEFINSEDTYNICLGGGPPPIPKVGRMHAKHTEETKHKISLASKGNPYGAWPKGKKQSHGHSKKISIALKGIKKSPEAIANMIKSRWPNSSLNV